MDTPDPLPELPESLHLADTGRTVLLRDVSKLSEKERRKLWYYGDQARGQPSILWPFYDDTGVVGFGPAASIPPFMRRKKLLDLGWTDARLEAERKRLFGARQKGAPELDDDEPDSIPLMERRKAVWDDVMRVLMAPE